MHQDRGVRAAEPVPARRKAGAVAVGAGAAMVGHLLTVAAFYAAGWAIGGYRGNSDELEAGGRFAVAFVSLAAFAFAQTVLLSVCVPVAGVLWRRRPGFAVGVLAGWGAGVVVLLALVAALFYYASRQRP
jgi:hypothetical protein